MEAVASFIMGGGGRVGDLGCVSPVHTFSSAHTGNAFPRPDQTRAGQGRLLVTRATPVSTRTPVICGYESHSDFYLFFRVDEEV